MPRLGRVCFFILDPGVSHQNASHFVLNPWLPSFAASAAFFHYPWRFFIIRTVFSLS
jgi:hypothetical protein